MRVDWERLAIGDVDARTSSTILERTLSVKKQKLAASPWSCHEESTRRGRKATHACDARVLGEWTHPGSLRSTLSRPTRRGAFPIETA